MFRKIYIPLFLILLVITGSAQQIHVSGSVTDEADDNAVPNSIIIFNDSTHCLCDTLGKFSCLINPGIYHLLISANGYKTGSYTWDVRRDNEKRIFALQANTLAAVTITGGKDEADVQLLNQTKGTTIYAGKKNEIINLNNIQANTATNNSRQLYAKVPGINIIENDEAGVQLSIATRGLNPNRTTEFNSRQNGYDISADPIGYPETYYTPVTDALSDIEIIRGAASLQYGTQFGGLLNFKFKDGPEDKPYQLVLKQTFGSYGFINSFNSIGGQYKNINYYCFYDYKRSDGWRQNTGFDVHNAYLSVKDKITSKITLGFEYTFMYYQMQQPGGLTDSEFIANPRQSLRDRNWFVATWNIPAITLDYNIDTNNLFTLKTYALIADRKNVGNLQNILIADNPLTPRTVMNDNYLNYYLEARYIHHYRLIHSLESSFLAGVRFYHGDTHRTQGYNYTGSDANFSIGNPNDKQIDYRFPSYNFAAFAENVFQITDNFSVTPGVRFEYIQTNGDGYTISDTTTNTKTYGNERHVRVFPLLGIGLDYKLFACTDVYANFSQNYSPVNFGDIVIEQPGMKVDPNLKDVKGYNIDIGYRGHYKTILSFDVSAFYMQYNNRIGTTLQVDSSSNIYQYETNISNSRCIGAETYAEVNILHIVPAHRYSHNKVALYGSVAYTNAMYTHTNTPQSLQFEGNAVEYAAPWICRAGLDYIYRNLSGSLQYSYTAAEYSDATNAATSTDGTVGIIPSYYTLDFTTSYKIKNCVLSFSANNLTNQMYFTRRTTGFPGPGIIPSIGRNFYFTLQVKL